MLSLVDEQVINFEMPESVAGYVQRIGRTGRAYNSGASVSLVSFLDKTNPLFSITEIPKCVICCILLSSLSWSIWYSMDILDGTKLHNAG